MSKRIEQLQRAVEKAFNCKAQHAFSTAVMEDFEGQLVWDGMVETFDIKGHPSAQLCYAFTFVEHDFASIKTILGVPPADTPQNAVKVAIASKVRQS